MACRKAQICAYSCKNVQIALLRNTPFSYTPFVCHRSTVDEVADHCGICHSLVACLFLVQKQNGGHYERGLFTARDPPWNL